MSLIHADNLSPQPWTDIFTDDTCIDRRKCHRTVPMKVLGLGVGRTGTACMYLDLRGRQVDPYTDSKNQRCVRRCRGSDMSTPTT